MLFCMRTLLQQPENMDPLNITISKRKEKSITDKS